MAFPEHAEVVGEIDVERETPVADDAEREPALACLRCVAAKRTGSVGELEVDFGGNAEHGCAVVTVARHDRDDRLRLVTRHGGERSRERQVSVRDHDTVASSGREPCATCVGGIVEGSRVIDHREAQVVGPTADVGVGRHDERLEPGSRGHHLLGKAAAEGGALIRVELLREARFAERERANRDHDAGSTHRHPT